MRSASSWKLKQPDTNIRRLTISTLHHEKMFCQEPPFERLSSVYIRKHLSEGDHDFEKTLLSKRYNKIHVEGKNEKTFVLKT